MTPTRLGRSLVHSTAGTAVTRGLGALAGVAIARLLGPSARGDVAILVVLASLASLVGAAGLQFWIIRDVARRAAVTRGTVAVVVRHSVAVLGVALVVGIVLGTLLVPGVIGVGALTATVAFAATGAIAFVWLALPNGARAMGVVSLATAAASAVYLAGALVLLAVDRPSITAVMALAAAGNVVTIAACAAYVLRNRDGTGAGVAVGPTWRAGLRFGAAGGAGELRAVRDAAHRLPARRALPPDGGGRRLRGRHRAHRAPLGHPRRHCADRAAERGVDRRRCAPGGVPHLDRRSQPSPAWS